MKKWMFILGVVLIGSFFGSFDVIASEKQELTTVDVLQNKSQLKVNFYHYSWINSVENAIEEADWFTKIANKYNVPKDSVMALDLENPVLTQNPVELTRQANGFFDRMIENGYPKIDVYASLPWFGTRFITEELRTKNYWVASWSDEKPEIVTGMWQFTNEYQLEGYDGLLDANIDFTGYYTK